MIKLIIAGSREIKDYNLLLNVIEEFKIKYNIENIDEIVCGEARGVDSLGKRYGLENNITIKSFPADWNKFGKSAGYIRNEEMAKYANSLIAIWDGKSKGTKHMIDLANKHDMDIIHISISKDK